LKVQYLSDLHFEFHADDGESFVASMDPTDVDVLVIAGDLAVGEGIGSALDRFCQRYESAKVLYVHGNHEYYGSDRASVVAISRAAGRRNANLHWLDGDVVTIGGQRFVGAPMWFRHPGPKAEVLKMMMNDFHRIRDFEAWVYEENARALAFFDKELAKGDVAITHYLPAEASIHSKWKGDPLNPYFLCDVEPMLRAKKPFAWIHGHTHESVDVMSASTKIVCNPFGYVGHELNRAFVDKAILNID
jgi:Icc-related predicted phosphoesterase